MTNTTKERPILFSGAMVRAILDGTKTQTRRVIKHNIVVPNGTPYYADKVGAVPCPYGAPGDWLWVRETWADVHPLQAEGRYSQPGQAGIPGPPPVGYRTVYRADGEYPPIWHNRGEGHPYRVLSTTDDLALKHFPQGVEFGWEPSIHMPRWASRITLEITGVRVERVQDISEADAKAEGAPIGYYERETLDGLEAVPTDRRGGFRALWDSINGQRGYGWQANPWVWVVEFRKV